MPPERWSLCFCIDLAIAPAAARPSQKALLGQIINQLTCDSTWERANLPFCGGCTQRKAGRGLYGACR